MLLRNFALLKAFVIKIKQQVNRLLHKNVIDPIIWILYESYEYLNNTVLCIFYTYYCKINTWYWWICFPSKCKSWYFVICWYIPYFCVGLHIHTCYLTPVIYNTTQLRYVIIWNCLQTSHLYLYMTWLPDIDKYDRMR